MIQKRFAEKYENKKWNKKYAVYFTLIIKLFKIENNRILFLFPKEFYDKMR